MFAPRFLPRAAIAPLLALAICAGGILDAEAQLFRRSPTPSEGVGGSSSDTMVRIDQLEQQVRSLTGQVEEYRHRVDQLEERLQRFQADTEYRFQESNGGAPPPQRSSRNEPPPRGDGGGRFEAPEPRQGAGQPDTYGGTRQLGSPDAGGGSQGEQFGGGGSGPLNISPGARGGGQFDGGFQPQAGGGRFDDIRGGGGFAGGQGASGGGGSGQVALAGTEDPQSAYDIAYSFVLQRDYESAQGAFSEFLRRYPDSRLAGNAQYWLGESYYAQGNYREAADAFLTGYQSYTDGGKGPDSLLKLAMSLDQMDQKDAACASFEEFGRKFPDASESMKRRVAEEQKGAGC